MKIKSLLAKPFASYIYKGIKRGMSTAVEDQESILKDLLKTGKLTDFGKEHHFSDIQNHEQYRQAVPSAIMSSSSLTFKGLKRANTMYYGRVGPSILPKPREQQAASSISLSVRTRYQITSIQLVMPFFVISKSQATANGRQER